MGPLSSRISWDKQVDDLLEANIEVRNARTTTKSKLGDKGIVGALQLAARSSNQFFPVLHPCRGRRVRDVTGRPSSECDLGTALTCIDNQ
jgi:hypothetical protein